MGMENKNGPMVRATKEIGLTIKLTDTENFFMLMEIFTRVNGEMIKPMGKETIFMQMAPNIQEIGKMISNMVLVLKHGQMELFTKVNITKEKRMVKESLLSRMDQFTVATSK